MPAADLRVYQFRVRIAKGTALRFLCHQYPTMADVRYSVRRAGALADVKRKDPTRP